MIPWQALDTVFLDAGGTLVSMDFAHVAQELAALGVPCEPDALRRAEAAARPAASAELTEGAALEGLGPFTVTVRHVLARLPRPPAPERLPAVARQLAERLHDPGHADRLWRCPLPGVEEALVRLRDLGLRRVVVSNSDGSVERGLRAAGLRHLLDQVVDSALVGYEKPDPRIFAHALGEAKAAPERTLHVGDLLHTDVAGARAAGVHALLLDPWNDWPDPGCERLPDLPALAARLAAARRS